MQFNIGDIEVDFRGKRKIVRGAIGYGPNYTFTGEQKEKYGVTLYQIVALDEFNGVVPGEIGGWIETPDNLTQDERAWVGPRMMVYGNSKVSGDSYISGFGVVENSLLEDARFNSVCENSLLITIQDSALRDIRLTGTELFCNKSDLRDVTFECFGACRPYLLSGNKIVDCRFYCEHLMLRDTDLESIEFYAEGPMDYIIQLTIKGDKILTRRPTIYLKDDTYSKLSNHRCVRVLSKDINYEDDVTAILKSLEVGTDTIYEMSDEEKEAANLAKALLGL